MLFEILLTLSVSLLAYAFIKWATLNDKYFVERNLPHLKPTFLLGNSGGLLLQNTTAADHMRSLYNSFSTEKMYGAFDFRRPQIIVRDPQLLKQLMITDFDHFQDHRMFVDASGDDLLGNILFMMSGQKWRDMRSTLSPLFTGSKLRQMYDLVSECAADTSKHFQRQATNGKSIQLEMKDLFSRYTIDVIATCAFGIKINSFEQPNNEFFETGKEFISINSSFLPVLRFLFLTALPSIAQKIGVKIVPPKVREFFMTMVLDTMMKRKEKGIVRPDMINLLMQLRDSDDKEQKRGESETDEMPANRKWSDSELVAQSFVFFAAGFDTSSTTLEFLMHELCINPDIQQKLYDEIVATNSISGGKVVDFDALQKMKYLDQVISETLRKWPAASLTDRVCVKDYVYEENGKKYRFEKGIAIQIPIYGLHHDPNYFADPEKFDPERFSDENKKNILPGTYLPFGMGPRVCIGKSTSDVFIKEIATNRFLFTITIGSRLALLKIKVIIYHLLLNFSLEPNENTQIPLRLKKSPFSLRSEKGVFLNFKPRKHFQ